MTQYLKRKEVAERYPISLSNLAHMASAGRGPSYRIVGKNAVYRVDEIEAWIEQQLVSVTKKRRARGRPRKNQSTSSLHEHE